MAAEAPLTPESVTRLRHSFPLLVPLFILVPIAFWWVFTTAGIPVYWGAFGLGALGWWVALLFRAPLALVAKRLGPERANTMVVLASGPCEELVRLALILLTGMTLPWAASLGQGWAAIEVLFAIISGFLQLAIMQRTDEKSRQAREILQSQLQQSMGMKGGQFVGIIERVFANAMHIGFTLLVAAHPLLVVLLVPAHSLVNLLSTKLAQHKLLQAEVLMGAVGTTALLLGLLAYKL